jgi:hypothetical protein
MSLVTASGAPKTLMRVVMFVAVHCCGKEGTTLHPASAISSVEAAAPQIFMLRRRLSGLGL